MDAANRDVVTEVILVRPTTGSRMKANITVELRNLNYVILTKFPGWKVEEYQTTPF